MTPASNGKRVFMTGINSGSGKDSPKVLVQAILLQLVTVNDGYQFTRPLTYTESVNEATVI